MDIDDPKIQAFVDSVHQDAADGYVLELEESILKLNKQIVSRETLERCIWLMERHGPVVWSQNSVDYMNQEMQNAIEAMK